MRLRSSLPHGREVHVWFVELAAEGGALEACSRTLSTDEQERSARFRFEHLRAAFTLARGTLRVLLGRYLAIEPERVRFAYGRWGKPRLAFPETPLKFNLSHAGKLAAYVFAVGSELGVDVEEVRPFAEQESIVRRFFSAEERDDWLARGPCERNEAFFRRWTAKEAYVKALGHGISAIEHPVQVARGWTLCSLAPLNGYVGALALPQRGREVRILPPHTAAAMLELVNAPGPFPPEGLCVTQVIILPESKTAGG
jgi:4'-phosphopantetheinyl transferase